MSEEQSLETFGSDEKVGTYLCRVREARGLKFTQMAKAIRLNEEILSAIEENRWEYFKIEAYLRSYIVSICEKLSLDKNLVLKQLSAEINSTFTLISSSASAASTASLAKETENESGQKSEKKAPVVEVVVVLLVIAVLFFVAKLLNSETEDRTDFYATEETDLFPENSTAQQSESDTLAQDTVKTDTSKAVPTVQTGKPIQPANQAQIIMPAAQPPAAQPLPSAKPEPAAQASASDDSSKDVLRFECSPSATDNTCGIKLIGFDNRMIFFKRAEIRYINHNDTSHVTVTVPERTRLLLNNERLDYGKFNTLLFYKGEIVRKTNRELR